MTSQCALQLGGLCMLCLWQMSQLLPCSMCTLTFLRLMLLQGQSTMQPGSKGGYYTEKSPKMLLLEWCQQQKRPKPKYKVLAAAAGTMRCRVSSARKVTKP